MREKLNYQYIYINRKKYAVGLFWQPISVVGYGARGYAHKLAKSVDKKLNLYVEYQSMIGLGAKKYGHKVGMPSLAVEVVESVTGVSSFLAAFQVERKYIIVSVRNGVILTDDLFFDESVAKQEFGKLAKMPDWNLLIAPNVWGVPKAVERDIFEIVNTGIHAGLHSISRTKTNMTSFMMLIVFFLSVLYFFKDPIKDMIMPKTQIAKINPELAKEYIRQIEEKNKELDEQFNMRQEPEPLVMPYDLLVDSTQRAELCYKAIGFLMQPVNGWNQISAECNENTAMVRFRRDFGTLGNFYNTVSDIMPGVKVQTVSDNDLIVKAKLPELEKKSSQDMRTTSNIVRDITTRFQSINTDVQVNVVVDVVSNETQKANLYVVEVAADSKLIPMQFMQVFDGFAGVYMTRCAWNHTKKIWNYEVIIYAKEN